jgi:hypothetical protein
MTLRRFVDTPRTRKNAKLGKSRKKTKKNRWNWMNYWTVCLSKRESYSWMLFSTWKVVIPIRPQNELQILVVAESCMTSIEESTCVIWASSLIFLTGEKYAVSTQGVLWNREYTIDTYHGTVFFFYRTRSPGGAEQNTVLEYLSILNLVVGVARVGSTSQPSPSQADAFEHANMACSPSARTRATPFAFRPLAKFSILQLYMYSINILILNLNLVLEYFRRTRIRIGIGLSRSEYCST